MARERKNNYDWRQQMQRAIEASEKVDEPTSVDSQIPVVTHLTEEKTEPVVPKQLEELHKVEEIEPKKEEPLEEFRGQEVLNKDAISRVISVYDFFVELEDKTKQTVLSYIQKDFNSPIEEIIHSIFSESNKEQGLVEFVNLRKLDGVNRAFTLFSYDEEKLIKLNSLTEKFSNGYVQSSSISNKVEYCRILEKGISEVPEQAINHLIPLGEILNIAKG